MSFALFTYDTDTHPLTVEEEVEAIEAAQSGDQIAYTRLLYSYGRTIRAHVNRAAKTMDTEDAQATALLEFAETLASHDPHDADYRDGRLAPRLVPRLKDALGIAQSGAATPFRIPKRTYTRYLGVLNAADGDPAAARALAPSFSLAESTFDEIHAMTHAATHASADADDDGHGAERAIELVYEPYTEAEDRILIDMSFAAMSDTEVRIVELKYAFTEYEEQTDAEIAHRMGMSRPTVQRRHSKALDKARKALGVTQDSE